METIFMKEAKAQYEKCCDCVYKHLDLVRIICRITGQRVKHHQKACEKFETKK